MKERLRKLWEERAPRERLIIIALAAVVGVALYLALVQSAYRARARLGPSVTSLRGQVALLEQQALEIERLRAAPAPPAAQSDLRALVQAQIGSAGLARVLGNIDAPDANQVKVVFGAVPFAEWLALVSTLQSQQVRLDACRIEAASTPGVVAVTATFVRAKS
ncbi:MAG: type II secretion system protein M [Betaproteobacteria bacterium]|nr:type II secretion system protein M [Betaproteobacteria bacterium]